MVDREILRAKIAHLQKSLSRLKKKQTVACATFLNDPDMQDIVLHNLQNTIQGCIDIASHIISDEGWEIPGTFGAMFDLLARKSVIDNDMAEDMWRAAGLRNLIVHEYAELDLKKIHTIFTQELSLFDRFIAALIDHFGI